MGEELTMDEEFECVKLMVNADNVRKFAFWMENMYLSGTDTLYRYTMCIKQGPHKRHKKNVYQHHHHLFLYL